MTVGTGSL